VAKLSVAILAMISAMALAAPARAAWPDDVSIVEWYASSLADIVQRAKKAADAKRDANAAIEAARAKFFADRKAGISDTESLREFELQLLAKDIYYLTPYLYEGMTPAAIKQFQAVEKATGGPLDGGLPPRAITRFETWVTMVRDALHAPPPGKFWMPSQDELIAALSATSRYYENYRVERDRAELWRWRTANQKAVPLAKTPEERADAYIKYGLDRDIDIALKDRSEQDRAAATAKLQPWREEIRKAIIDYEKSEVTREAVAACLRNVPEYKEEWVQRFLQETEPVSKLPPAAQFDAIVEAYLRIGETLDRERGTRYFRPPMEITRVRVKDCAAQPAQKRMIWLYREGQPIAFSRDPYWSVRGKQYYIYPDD
jgi:hypothetical protein